MQRRLLSNGWGDAPSGPDPQASVEALLIERASGASIHEAALARETRSWLDQIASRPGEDVQYWMRAYYVIVLAKLLDVEAPVPTAAVRKAVASRRWASTTGQEWALATALALGSVVAPNEFPASRPLRIAWLQMLGGESTGRSVGGTGPLARGDAFARDASTPVPDVRSTAAANVLNHRNEPSAAMSIRPFTRGASLCLYPPASVVNGNVCNLDTVFLGWVATGRVDGRWALGLP